MSGGDPISRFAFAVSEIDRVLGQNYARQHPEVLVAVMGSAASDYAALAIARAIDNVATALLEDVVEMESRGNLVPIRRAISQITRRVRDIYSRRELKSRESEPEDRLSGLWTKAQLLRMDQRYREAVLREREEPSEHS